MNAAYKYPILLLSGLLISLLAACATPKKLSDWGPKYATPGVHLSVHEVERGAGPTGGTEVVYTFKASGFPKNKSYEFWGQWLDGRTIKFAEKFYVDDSGKLVGGQLPGKTSPEGVALERFTFGLHGFAKGESKMYALISTDETVKAFARIVPFPIEAKEGSCRLSVELIENRGDLFGILAEGFEPDEEITTVSKFGDQVIDEGKLKVPSEEGKFLIFLLPSVIGGRSGPASFTASGKSCNLTVNYEWGPPALKKQ